MTKLVKNLSEYKEVNATLIKALLIANFSFFVFYLYFVGITVGAVIENKNNIKNFSSIRQEHQLLEAKYLSLVGKFDVDYARLMGFVEQGKNSEYVTRQNVFARLDQ